MIEGLEAKEVPEVPKVIQDKAPSAEHVITISHPGDEAVQDEAPNAEHGNTKSFSEDEDEEEKPPKDNVNKEGEVAADNNEEDGCTDERTDVVRPVDWEVKFRLRRDVVNQVAHENSIQGPTGSHMGSDQHPGHEHQIEEQDDKLKVRGLTFSVQTRFKIKIEGSEDLWMQFGGF